MPVCVMISREGRAIEFPLPGYATERSAGVDLRSAEDALLLPGERISVGTGIRLGIPEGYEGQVRPRSGLAIKHGVTVLNAPGTIDSDYRGEVRVLLVNLGLDAFNIAAGDRIAQIVIAPVSRVEWVESDSLDATGRGEGGFGSTGSS